MREVFSASSADKGNMNKYTAVYQSYVGMGHYVVNVHRMEAEKPSDVILYVGENLGDVVLLFKGFVEEV